MIGVSGAVVGQLNGSRSTIGDYSFSRPTRITARVSLGTGQVVNIDEKRRWPVVFTTKHS
jgi:hypothetical protein